ncbi:glycosyltransferase family 2 protein [Ornithinimicrobium cerasi]|uniref:Glycosyl transferase family 2 n=1 Tax=Ornithinimicrobium cerasi TaxID=2248773 RepID=A0A285VVT4_9MICO|nr:glycosyltransferase family A protein [Ornithinimicrobium cerasi]SOC58132.1 Glycosyl transferase family 2 [Ornithinimicrobium cerasi]
MQPGQVTIVIPTFNDAPEHLRESVASALGQTYPHIEVVVVDDGSTRPDTITAVDALEGVRVVRQVNAGLSAARNAGIRVGSGEYIYPLDADDWIEPDVVELLVGILCEDVVVAYPLVEMFGESTGRTDSLPETTLGDLVLYNRIVAASLFRREHWEDVGGYLEERGFAEDWVMWATILGRTGGRAVRCGEAVMHYRQRMSSLNKTNSSSEGRVLARRKIAEALPERRADLFEAATTQCVECWAEVDRIKFDAARWRRVEPLVRPVVSFVRLVRRNH